MKTIINILQAEAAVLNESAAALQQGCESFSAAEFCRWLRAAEQVIFIGVGKSGHVARKAAASFASLGFRAHFCHAAELMHGDLGAIDGRTLAIFASFSGRGAEILAAAAQVCARTKMCLALSAPKSALAGLCKMNLPLSCSEAIAGLPAPTSSTTLTLALCDGLLALAAAEFGLGAADFGRHHPGGALGKRYYERVRDCLEPARTIAEGACLREAIAAMSGAGYAVLLAPGGAVAGFLSDGDLRRALESADFSLEQPAINYASRRPVCVRPNLLAHEARELAKSRKISTLLVVEGGEGGGETSGGETAADAQLLGVMRLI